MKPKTKQEIKRRHRKSDPSNTGNQVSAPTITKVIIPVQISLLVRPSRTHNTYALNIKLNRTIQLTKTFYIS